MPVIKILCSKQDIFFKMKLWVSYIPEVLVSEIDLFKFIIGYCEALYRGFSTKTRFDNPRINIISIDLSRRGRKNVLYNKMII